MQVDKPEWFDEAPSSRSKFDVDMVMPTGRTTVYVLTCDKQDSTSKVEFDDRFWTAAGLKELAKQLYHLALYLEQNETK